MLLGRTAAAFWPRLKGLPRWQSEPVLDLELESGAAAYTGCRKARRGYVPPLGVAWIISSLYAGCSSSPGQSRPSELQHVLGDARGRDRGGFDKIRVQGGDERLFVTRRGGHAWGGHTTQLPDRLGQLLGLEPRQFVLAFLFLVEPVADLEAEGTGIFAAEGLCDCGGDRKE